MEHRKAETLSQFTNLKKECEMTITLLNQILQKNHLHVKNIDNLSAQNLRKQSKYFLAVSQFQHESYQKILELNVNLEEFLVDTDQSKAEELARSPSLVSLTSGNMASGVFEPLLYNTVVSNESISDKPASVTPENTLPVINNSISNESSTSASGIDDANINNEAKTLISTNNSEDFLNQANVIEKANINDEIKTYKAQNVTITTSTPLHQSPATKYENHQASSISTCSSAKIVSKENCLNESLSEHFYSATDTRDSSSEMDFCSNVSSNDCCELVTVLNNDDKSVSSEMEFCSNVSSHIENKKEQDDKLDSIADKLNALPVMTVEEKCQTNNFMFNEKEEDDKISSISEELNALPVMTVEEKCQTNNFMPNKEVEDKINSISEKLNALSVTTFGEKCQTNNYMPDLSMKPALIKCSEAVTRIGPSFEEKNEKLCTKKQLSFKEDSKKICDIPTREAPKVNDFCMLGFIKSPSDFYIQVADDNSDLIDLISTQLETMWSKSSCVAFTKCHAREKLGNFCAVHIDEYWYRAQVLDWMMNENSDSVYVQLVDYGDKYTTSYKDLKPLVSSLRVLPKLAQRCHLAYLYPPGSTENERGFRWPQESLDEFLRICGDLNETLFRIDYVSYCKERNSYEVELSKCNSNDSNTVGTQLIQSKRAVGIVDDFSKIIPNSFMMNQIRTAQGRNKV